MKYVEFDLTKPLPFPITNLLQRFSSNKWVVVKHVTSRGNELYYIAHHSDPENIVGEYYTSRFIPATKVRITYTYKSKGVKDV